MKTLIAVLIFLACHVPAMAQEQERLNQEWLAQDYRSIELISLLASPASLTFPGIREILNVDGSEQDLGFGASKFNLGRGYGYTHIYVRGVAFEGAIASYTVGISASRESWPQIRERVIDLWLHNGGPAFTEDETGVVHTETNENLLRKYKSAVAKELGEMTPAELPYQLKGPYHYLISPLGSQGISSNYGEDKINVLVAANRIDLIENVLRSPNPSSRIYAARALLKLAKDNRLILDSNTLEVIAKIRKLNIRIVTGRGCILTNQTADQILKETDNSDPN